MTIPSETNANGPIAGSPAENEIPVLQWPIASFASGEASRLGPGELHLWAAAFGEFGDRLPELRALLTESEKARAEKFKFARDRDRYLIRHGLLRLILGRYLHQDPSAIDFRVGASGKPEVRIAAGGAALFFNASHSAEIALWAIASACPVGVDIERVREIPDIEKIARRFFHPRETATLMALPPDARLAAFHACWTRKEAFLKTTGEGIAQGVAKVEVTLAPGDAAAVVSIAEDSSARERWQLHSFSPASGYVGCVAYENKASALTLSQWRAPRSLQTFSLT